MQLTLPPIDPATINGFDEEIDIFNRKVFGGDLTRLVKNSSGNLVIGFDDDWGRGKTTFLAMWQAHMANMEDPVHSIYFDAFKHDYYADPLIALTAQIYSRLQKVDASGETAKRFSDTTVNAAKALGKLAGRVAIKVGAKYGIDEEALGELKIGDTVGDELATLYDKALMDAVTQSGQVEAAITSFGKALSGAAEVLGGGNPLVFIIDELDRCRPNYALSIIECIKHFLMTPNIVFVLSMNREQMLGSVACEYGEGVKADRYLDKFIQLWVSLPTEGREEGTPKEEQYLRYCLSKMGYPDHLFSGPATAQFGLVIASLRLTFRDIERIATNMMLLALTEPDARVNGKENISKTIIFFICAIVKTRNPDLFKKILADPDDVLDGDVLKEMGFNHGRVKSIKSGTISYKGLIEKIVRYCFGTDTEKNAMTNNGEVDLYTMDTIGGGNKIAWFCKKLSLLKPVGSG